MDTWNSQPEQWRWSILNGDGEEVSWRPYIHARKNLADISEIPAAPPRVDKPCMPSPTIDDALVGVFMLGERCKLGVTRKGDNLYRPS